MDSPGVQYRGLVHISNQTLFLKSPVFSFLSPEVLQGMEEETSGNKYILSPCPIIQFPEVCITLKKEKWHVTNLFI